MIPDRTALLVERVKVLIIKTMMEEGLSSSDLLARLGEPPTSHLYTPHRPMTLKRVARLLEKMGKRLRVEIEDDV